VLVSSGQPAEIGAAHRRARDEEAHGLSRLAALPTSPLPDQGQCRKYHDGKNAYHPGHITVSFLGNDHSDRLRKVTRFVRSLRVRDPAFGDAVV
jgi:hypothetical protein